MKISIVEAVVLLAVVTVVCLTALTMTCVITDSGHPICVELSNRQ